MMEDDNRHKRDQRRWKISVEILNQEKFILAQGAANSISLGEVAARRSRRHSRHTAQFPEKPPAPLMGHTQAALSGVRTRLH